MICCPAPGETVRQPPPVPEGAAVTMSETESMTSFRPNQPSQGISIAGRLARLAGALGLAALLAACQADEIGYGEDGRKFHERELRTAELERRQRGSGGGAGWRAGRHHY